MVKEPMDIGLTRSTSTPTAQENDGKGWPADRKEGTKVPSVISSGCFDVLQVHSLSLRPLSKRVHDGKTSWFPGHFSR